MVRMLLQYLVPLLLPTLVYLLWIKLRGRPPEDDSDLRHPWFWLALAGLFLMLGTLAALALSEGAPAGSAYTPPRFEDGKVIPGEATPRQ